MHRLLCFLLPAVFLLCGTRAVLAQSNATGEAGLAGAYYHDREYAQALELYLALYQRDPDAELFVQRIVDCYVQLKQMPEASNFLTRLVKRQPDRPQYSVMLIQLHEQAGQQAEAQQVMAALQGRIKSPLDAQSAGAALLRARRFEAAIQAYKTGRKVSGDDSDFALELAQAYRMQGKLAEAATELLAYYKDRPTQLPLVQRELSRMVQSGNAGPVEDVLLQAIQRDGNNLGLREMLYQLYLRSENYDQAILLARSLDRLRREDGTRLYRLAMTLQHNQQYLLSNRALDVLTATHEDSPHLLNAYFERAKNYELAAFQQRPLDTSSLRQAVANYESLFEQFGRRERFAEAMLRKARLHTFYLNQPDQAIAELRLIEDLPIKEQTRAQAQLLLGDIYLMEGQPAKARIKFQEVEEMLPDAQEGAEAKFRSARLAYYQGDFELAKARLRTLKDNTSDNISNDAIDLYLTVQENTGLDSTPKALQQFARTQLLVYQHAYPKAMTALDSLLTAYPNHPITDNALWEKVQVLLAWNRVQDVMPLLDRILKGFPADLLADDALFLKAELTERNLTDPATAQQLYLDLITKYPSSLFNAEARRRIRVLRGESQLEPDA